MNHWKERITRLVEEWQGKEIKFPDRMLFTRFVTDTVDYQIPQSDYKVLIYVDSIGYTSCKLQLTFQTFLLDRNNRVAVIGNPVHNLQVKELYLKQLTGKASPTAGMVKTIAEVVNPEIDFGTFPKSDVKSAIFEIRNTGDNPLVIVDVSTSCSCTAPKFDKVPAKPGDLLQVEVQMTPKETGPFDEVVTVKCNTNKPVKVKIRGNVQE